MYTTGRGGWHLDTQSDVPDAIRPWPCKEHPLDATCILLNPDGAATSDFTEAVPCHSHYGQLHHGQLHVPPVRSDIWGFHWGFRAQSLRLLPQSRTRIRQGDGYIRGDTQMTLVLGDAPARNVT
ncbi:hypothetical protein PGT21_032100 [Puccinia graminis f. sp. tritici]|uniref:Uncharacterized protein n=1 Tax=Puccinia graminis f. sp. tritici TaxID=56615 RepID=A0A5B0R2A6_PUCGR|nr:hypothetical protein PGT21_032100 [Puccinia graminis f. sp. tritici]